MPTISFYAGYELKDKGKILKILKILQEPGQPVKLTHKERKLLKKQETDIEESLERLSQMIDEL